VVIWGIRSSRNGSIDLLTFRNPLDCPKSRCVLLQLASRLLLFRDFTQQPWRHLEQVVESSSWWIEFQACPKLVTWSLLGKYLPYHCYFFTPIANAQVKSKKFALEGSSRIYYPSKLVSIVKNLGYDFLSVFVSLELPKRFISTCIDITRLLLAIWALSG